MNVLIPDLAPFKELKVPGATLIPFGRGQVAPQAEGLVLWSLPRAELQAALKLPTLRWVLTLSAGVNHVIGELPAHLELFNASRLHDDAVAQHALATLLAVGRGLHLARDQQRAHLWKRSAALWTLRGKRVVLWGYGHIGRRLEGMLAPLGAEVRGLRSGDGPSEVQGALAWADIVALLLPATPRTHGLVNAEVLARIRPGAWLANFGRGELVVTADLIAALHSGQLGGAILDVTDPEPLPAESELWSMDNVLITPHSASTTDDMVERAAAFAGDFLERLIKGEPLDNRVERSRGY